MKRLIMLVACMALLVGCTPMSMNVQRASIRSGGDVGVTVALDAVAIESVDDVKAKVEDTAKAVLKFLEDGQVADLTQSAARRELEKLIPLNLRPYFDAVMSILSTKDVDISKLGADNVKRLKAGAAGVLSGCAQYANEDRPPPDEKKSDT
jgi:hypothetical protein